MESLKSKFNIINENSKVVVALSGGIDSVVLLHWLYTNYKKNNIKAIHINHNLSPNSRLWDEFCNNLCKKFNIEYLAFDIYPNKSKNTEADARNKRYKIFKQNLQNGEYLCCAHHQYDQVETLLLQLFRGAGVAGLAAMPKIRPFAKGYIVRPFLDITKHQIEQYAIKHNLNWVEDESNNDLRYKRNFIRKKLIPNLLEQWQGLITNISRSAKHQAETLELIRYLAKKDINDNNLLTKNKLLKINPLLKLPHNRIKNILRYHISLIGFQTPSSTVLNEIISNILLAKKDAKSLVIWGNNLARKYKDKLYILEKKPKKKNSKLKNKYKDIQGFNISYRKGGEIIKLKNHIHSKKLKKILQEKNIPPWERDKLEMYFIKDKLVAIEKIGEVENIKVHCIG